jgi:hypothetical protein
MTMKNSNAAKTTITRDVSKLDKETGNVYETVCHARQACQPDQRGHQGRTGRQVGGVRQNGENLEEVYENREQIEVSKHYERMPKPARMAIQELMDGKLYFRRPEVIEPAPTGSRP